jgi:hypothetical protein
MGKFSYFIESRGKSIMGSHPFNFDGGDELSTIGASWFVSYLYYKVIDQSHTNWNKVKTYKSRISTFNASTKYHRYWLGKIMDMNNENLNKNTILLSSVDIKKMTMEILKSYK